MEFHNEMMYQIMMSIAKKLHESSMISDLEYSQIDTMFIEKYHPKIGILFVDLQPKQR